MDEDGVEQAARAFLINDPFYPRPKSNPALWAVFRDEYLKLSSTILTHRGQGYDSLPCLFVRKLEESLT